MNSAPRARIPMTVAIGLIAAGFVGGSPRPAQPAISVPFGYFSVTYASGVPRLTSLTFAADSSLYATQLDGNVFVFRDRDRNGAADTVITYTSGLTWPLGMTFHGGYAYINSLGQVYRFRDANGDHRADEQTLLVTNLPTGRHWNTAVLFGPDGNLYVGLGSMKNLGVQPNPLCASILRYTPDGTFIDQFATGFRNPYGMAFHASGELFCTENGPGPDSLEHCLEPPDELNWVREHRHYGFPDCIGVDGRCADLGDLCTAPPCSATECAFDGGCVSGMEAPIRTLPPHSSSDGLCFGAGFTGYTADDVFIAQYGQNEVVPGCPTDFGHRVVRTRLHNTNGVWTAGPVTDFATGFTHPLAVAVGPDHALYVADYGTGMITRIAVITSQTGVAEERPHDSARRAAFDLLPNPASAAARLVRRLPSPEPGDCDIFDVAGRRRFHRAGIPPEGFTWDLRDDAGQRVPAGVYLVRLTVGTAVVSRRLLVVG